MGRFLDMIRDQKMESTASVASAKKQANDAKEGRCEIDELFESMQSLEAAGIYIAVREDGSMRLVVTEREAGHSIDGGATAYSPQDMYEYVTLTERERRMLHDFKKRFGGTIEWKLNP
jgi:hypothetical protein